MAFIDYRLLTRLPEDIVEKVGEDTYFGNRLDVADKIDIHWLRLTAPDMIASITRPREL